MVKTKKNQSNYYDNSGKRALIKVEIKDCPYGKRLKLLKHPKISEESKEKLKEQYDKLNPAEIQRQIIEVEEKLLEKILLKEEVRKSMSNNCKMEEKFCHAYV